MALRVELKQLWKFACLRLWFLFWLGQVRSENGRRAGSPPIGAAAAEHSAISIKKYRNIIRVATKRWLAGKRVASTSNSHYRAYGAELCAKIESMSAVLP